MDYFEDHVGGKSNKWSRAVKKMKTSTNPKTSRSTGLSKWSRAVEKMKTSTNPKTSRSTGQSKLSRAVEKMKTSTNPNTPSSTGKTNWARAVEKMKTSTNPNTPSPAPVDVPAASPAPSPAPVDVPAASPAPSPAPVDVPAASPAPTPAPVDVPAASLAPTPAPVDVPAQQKKTSFFNKFKSGMKNMSSRVRNPFRTNGHSSIMNDDYIVMGTPDTNVTSDTKVEPEIKSKPPPIVKKEPTVVYYNDALDTFTYIIVVLIISFFIFIILKDLYRSLKLYYSNIRIPKVKMNMFDGKTSYNDDNQFDSNDYRNNNWTESIKYMIDKKNEVLEDEFSIIRKFKEINKLPNNLHTSISIANIKDSDDEYEYNKKDGQSFVEALFTKPKHYKYLNNSDFRY